MREQWSPSRLYAMERAPLRFAIVVLVLYAATTLFVALHHEPWRDEAESWLVAKDVPLSELFQWTRHDGTPALWHLLLKPLAWLDLGYASQTLLHLALAWIAAGVVLFLSPFTRLTKVLFLASYYPIYQYSVVARSYVLTALLLFVVCALYERRHERPVAYATVVALLFNANLHGAVIAGFVTFAYILDRPRTRRGALAVAIMSAGALAAFLQLRPPSDAAYPGIIRFIDPDGFPFAIGNAFLPGLPRALSFSAGLIVLALVIFALRSRPDALLILCGSIAILGVIFTFIWLGGYQHAGIILLVVIAGLWIGRALGDDRTQRATAVLLNVTFLISGIYAIAIQKREIESPYSGSKEIAEFIRSNHLQDYELAAHNPYAAVAVVPYLQGKSVWYAGLQRDGTYLSWDANLRQAGYVSYDAAQQRARIHFEREGKPWLLLLNVPLSLPNRRGYRLVYTTREPFRARDERYWLYEPIVRPE